MKSTRNSIILLIGNSILFIMVAALLVAPVWKRRTFAHLPGFTNLLPAAAQINPWTQAVEKVMEDRGEPVGKQAKVETPAQLRHYSDTRRFLAIQVAEVKEHTIETPQDLVDLAGMIGRGELVQLQPNKENYILFGVGGHADKQPFTRYESGKSIRLYNEAGLRQEYDRLRVSQSNLASEIADLKKQIGSIKRRERAQRAKLQNRINALEKSLKLNREDKASLDQSYGNAKRRDQLFADHASFEKLAQENPGKPSAKIGEAAARQKMKVRMLSSLRPEALKVLEEVADSYHERFLRPLPITSLVRPDEYQHQLRKTNPNATRIQTPPHSTGLAFDILYRYMSAAEQSHVMSDLARLKDEGRIEVLRENRDHYHVFAFVDGARPREEFISAVLGGARSAKTVEVQTRKPSSARAAKRAIETHHKQASIKKSSSSTFSPTRTKKRR